MTDIGKQTAAVGTTEESTGSEEEEEVDTSHLDGVDDGCGCAEVWEHLSDERDE